MPAAELQTTCATCQTPGSLTVRQEISDGRLTWSEAFACGCGHGFEASGVGLPTEAQRRVLLAQVGRGEVWLDQAAGRARTIDVLVKVFDEPEGSLHERLARLPAVAWEGTQTEAEFVALALGRQGVATRVVKHGPKLERRD